MDLYWIPKLALILVHLRFLWFFTSAPFQCKIEKLIFVSGGLAMIIFVQLPELFGSKSSVRSPLKEVELEEAVSSLLPEFHPKKSELQSALSRLDDFADLHENLRQKIIELEEVFSRFPHLEAAGKVVQQNKLDLQETHSGIVRLEILKARLNHKPVPGSVS